MYQSENYYSFDYLSIFDFAIIDLASNVTRDPTYNHEFNII